MYHLRYWIVLMNQMNPLSPFPHFINAESDREQTYSSFSSVSWLDPKGRYRNTYTHTHMES